MSRQVKDVLNGLNPFHHGITIAIHKNKKECMALFRMPKQLGSKHVEFCRWNEDVKNSTKYKTKETLLEAYVDKVWETSADWVCIEILPF